MRTDSASIRTFLGLYDQYRKEITARALQVAVVDATTTEPVRPVNLTYCVNPEWLASIVELQLIPDLTDPDALTDSMLRTFLEERAQVKKKTIGLPALNALIDKELRMDMSDTSATMRMENLFASYLSLLRRHGLKWVTSTRPKIAIRHIISAVRPKSLRIKLESNIEFSHMELQNDFNSFFKHAVSVSQSFDDLDNGPTHRSNQPRARGNGSSSAADQRSKTQTEKSRNATKQSYSRNKFIHPCPHPPCKDIGARHWVDDCEECSEEEKRRYKAEFAAKKAADGPSKSTRSQKNKRGFSQSNPEPKGTVNRLRPATASTSRAFCIITLSDGKTSLDGTGRCDDGSDDSIVSPSLAEKAALKGIGKIAAIKTTHLSVALKTGSKPQSFVFSRTWTAPRTVLHLPSGNLALVNITYLVADNDLACEELLIGRPVLRHLRVDTETLLDSNRFALNGADCSDVGNPTVDSQEGYVSRLLISRLQNRGDAAEAPPATPSPLPNRPRVNYKLARREQDPFPDPSLLDPVDSDQHEEIDLAVQNMMENARYNGMESNHLTELGQILAEHKDIFRVALSAGPAANIRPLKIELVPEAKPVRVRLRNYSQDQRTFLQNFVEDLVRTGMAYANPTSPWASAPLIVPKPGPARFRFTVDLRPVNKFTVKHQYPMPNIEQELLKLAGSRFFATFDLSHGYWQFPLDKTSQALQSFITPDGIFSPTRVLHGTTNATTHLQSVLAEIFPKDLRDVMMYWLDDILLHVDECSNFPKWKQCFRKGNYYSSYSLNCVVVHAACTQPTQSWVPSRRR